MTQQNTPATIKIGFQFELNAEDLKSKLSDVLDLIVEWLEREPSPSLDSVGSLSFGEKSQVDAPDVVVEPSDSDKGAPAPKPRTKPKPKLGVDDDRYWVHKNVAEGRKAVANGERPPLKKAVAMVMGDKVMNARDVVGALEEKGWAPASNNPYQYVSFVLASNRPEVFERTGKRGYYRVRPGYAV
jgi:hypothetical protein